MPIRKVSFENPHFTGTEAAKMPVGTTAERANAVIGDLRHNSDLDQLEQYTTDGWKGISAPPTISSIDVSNLDETDDPQTIVITGQNFDSNASAVLIDNNGTTVAPTTSTRNSSSQITIVFSGGDTLDGTTAEPLDVKVNNGSGLSAVLENAVTIDASPTWTTAAGTVATAYEDTDDLYHLHKGNYSSLVTLSSSSNYSTRTPSLIFDGLFGGSDGWANNTGTNEWIKLDFGYEIIVQRWMYWNHDGQSSKTGDFLEASNDDSTWTQIASYGSVSNGNAVTINAATIGNTPYRYWRIRRTWSSANWGILSGLQVNYYPSDSDTTLKSGSSVSASVVATDPEGETVSYTQTGGTLPTGVTLSGNTVSGFLDGGNSDYNTSGVQHNFTITADDGTGNTTPRTFNILRKWYDGSSSANAAINADSIKTITGATSSDDGQYWIKPFGQSAVQVQCEFNSFGGWMLLVSSQGTSSPVPTGTGASGTVQLGSKGKFADSVINAIYWRNVWHGMCVGNGSDYTMDYRRQVFTTENLQFHVIWDRYYNQWTGGNIGNGRNQVWSYKGPGGSGGSYLTGSSRQPAQNVINSDGSTDYNIGNTNTYSISPHDAGIGGAWLHATDGSNSYFNTGFGSDYNNQPYSGRHAYWFFR